MLHSPIPVDAEPWRGILNGLGLLELPKLTLRPNHQEESENDAVTKESRHHTHHGIPQWYMGHEFGSRRSHSHGIGFFYDPARPRTAQWIYMFRFPLHDVMTAGRAKVEPIIHHSMPVTSSIRDSLKVPNNRDTAKDSTINPHEYLQLGSSSPLIIRVPFFLLFCFNQGDPPQKKGRRLPLGYLGNLGSLGVLAWQSCQTMSGHAPAAKQRPRAP